MKISRKISPSTGTRRRSWWYSIIRDKSHSRRPGGVVLVHSTQYAAWMSWRYR